MIYAAFTTEGLEDSLIMMASGFIVVMSVLILLLLSITVIGWIFSALDRKKKKKATGVEASLTPTGDATSAPSGLSASTLALIAAAVHTTVNGPYRIVGIEHRHSSHDGENLQVSSWSVEGRRAIFSSHRVR